MTMYGDYNGSESYARETCSHLDYLGFLLIQEKKVVSQPCTLIFYLMLLRVNWCILKKNYVDGQHVLHMSNGSKIDYVEQCVGESG